MAVDKTILQYKEMTQLQEFAQAQQTTIIQLSKKIQKLEDERDHLKTLLESSVPLLRPDQAKELDKLGGNETEYVCHNEIKKLKENSLERELTYEECRKLDTYFKILTQINSFAKPIETKAKQMSTEEILRLVESDDNGTK